MTKETPTMSEKKPDPKPAPRNRQERRKRAAEERKARPWYRVPPPDPAGTFETISPGKVRGPDGTTWEVVGEAPLDETKVVVPGEDGKPALLQKDDLQITEVSLVTITPEIVAKVAERTGRTVDEVNAYLTGPEQDAALLGAFLFFGVGPVSKLPPSRLSADERRGIGRVFRLAAAAGYPGIAVGPPRAP